MPHDPMTPAERDIALALEYLRAARTLLSGCPKTQQRVRHAISSALGAARHAANTAQRARALLPSAPREEQQQLTDRYLTDWPF